MSSMENATDRATLEYFDHTAFSVHGLQQSIRPYSRVLIGKKGVTNVCYLVQDLISGNTTHQTTAYGNSTPAPSQQIFTSSPAFQLNANSSLQDKIYEQFLKNADVSSLAELRTLSSEVIIRANELSAYQANYGSSNFEPIVGDAFVPSPPDVLLAQGRYAKNIKALMVSHNTDEGLLFTNPAIQNTTAFNAYLQQALLPAMSSSDFDYVANTLYPAIFTNDTFSRLPTLIADLSIKCNADALLKTFAPNVSKAFLFGEGAGLHGEDTAYIFYNPPGPANDAYGIGQVNTTSAQTMQDWIVRFVVTGDPNGVGINNTDVDLPVYGPGRQMVMIRSGQLGKIVPDPAHEQRCQYWPSGKYLGVADR